LRVSHDYNSAQHAVHDILKKNLAAAHGLNITGLDTDLGPIIADSSLARNSPLIPFKMRFSSVE
jgi:hypothetical protein